MSSSGIVIGKIIRNETGILEGFERSGILGGTIRIGASHVEARQVFNVDLHVGICRNAEEVPLICVLEHCLIFHAVGNQISSQLTNASFSDG